MSTQEHSFASLLTHEIDLLKSLHSVMRQEQQSVEENNIEQLIPISEQKHQLLEQVERATQQREQFLLGAIKADNAQLRLEGYIHQAPDSELLQQQYDLLRETLKECQKQNDINAMIISMNQRHVEKNLNIMKGIDNSSMTYNAQGATEARTEQLRGVKA